MHITCYAVFQICSAEYQTLWLKYRSEKNLLSLLETLIFLNSSLNPVIYCWRMTQIRRAIIDVVWNLPRKRHSSRYIYNRSSNFVLANNWTLAWDLWTVCNLFSAGKRWQTQDYLPVGYRSQTTMVYKLLIGKDGFQGNSNARFIFDGQWNCCCW